MHAKKITTLTLLLLSITVASLLVAWTNSTGDPNPLAADIKKAVLKTLPLLQTTGHKFVQLNKRHCVSCHNNLLTGMLEAKMDQKGLPVVDSFRTERLQTIAISIRSVGNINNPDLFIGSKFVLPYALMGYYADKGQPDPNTDIAVDYILSQQQPDGSFQAQGGRPPHETGAAHCVAVNIRGLQLYASPAKKARVEHAMRLSRQWLTTYQPNTRQELTFQLLGLCFTGASDAEKETIAARLKAAQNPDGSWSQLPSMHGDAYATGEALYALSESGMTRPEEVCAQHAIGWLLKHQDPSGAWIVETRAYPIQPFFNAGFPPYDENQFISAAATNWACLALLSTLPDNQQVAITAKSP